MAEIWSFGWILPFLLSNAMSLAASVFFVLTARSHIELTSRRADLGAVQASHRVPTPRIGGLAIFVGLVVGVATMPPDLQPFLLKLLLAGTPVLMAGLLEDLGRTLSPRLRLMASALSALLAILLTGAMVRRVDLPVDTGLQFLPVAIAFTTFAVAGMCNAINLVDGMNGLAGFLSVLSAAGLGWLGWSHDEPVVAVSAGLLASVLLGFLVVNYPRGLIFLGDAGAYFTGFVLAWLSVVLLHERAAISAWALVLVNFWPVADTLWAIYRRRSRGKATDMPDRLHFHQLIRRWLEITRLGPAGNARSNPMTTALIVPCAAIPVISGVMLAEDTLHAALAVGCFATLFVLTYVGLLNSVRGRGRATPISYFASSLRKRVA